ncbi:pyridoxal-phosphate-dependent aminotransferase family protein [Actinomadura sp. 9N215]|uniref:pyridoxal-phosphate-dependent aminotransferase family protein n=1 Tax=Actinomadura sp. 9N215 TaxID=3375150 RepID=UPI00378A26F1
MRYKHRLMVPGPTPLPPEVTAAATWPLEDERTPRFARLFVRVIDGLREVLRTRNDVLVFTSSMTGAFEGAIQNLFSPGDRVLVLNNGAFGARWVDLCRVFGLDVVELSAPWGDEISPARVAAVLDGDPSIVAAVAVHSETSTGVVNDMAGFGAVTRDVLSIVDTTSGAGACDLRTDDWGLDVVVGGGQKALMTPPGLAFASLSERAWHFHRRAGLPRFYFDWTAAWKAFDREVPQSPWTPAITLLVQMDAALRHLREEGLERVLHRHLVLGRVTRAAVRAMGLTTLSPDDDRSAAVTTVFMPDGVDADQIVLEMGDRYGAQIVGGHGPLAGRVVRLGHCGYVDALDVITMIAALELTLRSLAVPIPAGAGVAAAVEATARHSGAVPGLGAAGEAGDLALEAAGMGAPEPAVLATSARGGR